MKLSWLVHGVPYGQKTNATETDSPAYDNYAKLFYSPNITRADETWHKTEMKDGTIAYTVCRGGGINRSFLDTMGRTGSYAGVTLFIKDATIPDDRKLLAQISQWFNQEIMHKFVSKNQSGVLQWRPDISLALFDNKYDQILTDRMWSMIQDQIIDESNNSQKSKSMQTAAQKLQDEIAKLEHDLAIKRAELAKLTKNTK